MPPSSEPQLTPYRGKEDILVVRQGKTCIGSLCALPKKGGWLGFSSYPYTGGYALMRRPDGSVCQISVPPDAGTKEEALQLVLDWAKRRPCLSPQDEE